MQLKKCFYLLLLIFTVSCKDVENKKLVTKADTLVINTVTSTLDSALKKSSIDILTMVHYVKMNRDFYNKKQEYEILYLRTGNDKYRILSNNCIDSVNKYYDLMHSIK